jgi:hypothetical protein
MTLNEWQRRLSETFSHAGVIGGSLFSVFNAEDVAASYVVNTFKGQNVLLDSFMGFFVDTLGLAYQQISEKGWPKERQNYPVALVCFTNLFRRFRACELLYGRGYPLDAYALMRDLKDRAMMLGAVAHNKLKFSELIGAPETPITDADRYGRTRTRNRKDAEQRISHGTMGKNSGLSPEAQSDLKLWGDFFNNEVHGGQLTLMQELGRVAKGELPQVGPATGQDAFVLYMNRSAEIGWMIVRLLPFLQTTENLFGDRWRAELQILDESFRYRVEELWAIGKRVGGSFITMMDTHFTFQEPFYYFEADAQRERD